MAKEKITNLNTYLIIALVIVVAVGLYFTLSVPVAKKEAPKPIPAREIQLQVLGSDCSDCFNISVAVDFIKKQSGINVTDVKEISMEDAKALTDKYNITRLPALLIMGNISNLTIPNFNQVQDALVFSLTPPPYYDVAEKTIKGKVGLTLLKDDSCTNCFNMSLIVDQLKQAGIKVASEKTIDSKSDEGKTLIQKYKIEKIPTLLFTKDALEYDVIKQVWSQVGSEESDGQLVLRFVNPPYVNVSTGKTEGMVGITYLVDESCTNCYNASVFKGLFGQSFNMYFEKEETLDVSSTKGKFLLKKYGIDLVPTVLLSNDAQVYPNLAQAWSQVGTVEKDGEFVFRKIELLENYFKQTGGAFAYKNLTSGAVLNGSTSNATEGNTTQPDIAPPQKE